MPLAIKTIRLHCLPARQHDRRQYSHSHARYSQQDFPQLPSRAFQVLQQNMNPRSGERCSSDYSQYPGSYVLPFHVGLPRASSLVLPTCRTAARKIDKRFALFLLLIFLPSISVGDTSPPKLRLLRAFRYEFRINLSCVVISSLSIGKFGFGDFGSLLRPALVDAGKTPLCALA